MKYVIPGANVKLFGKAIHCLAKIGDEVYLEPEKDSLSLRTVNSSRSAYATFKFGINFFATIEQSKSKERSLEEEQCKVMMRSLLLAFRSLSVLEKTVDSCLIETGEDCKLLVTLNCRHSVTKHFSMGLVECETLRAVYDVAKCNNKWIIQAKVMQEANGNFLASQEEVTMHVAGDSFKLRNYDDDLDEKKRIHTELSMQPGEFEYYHILENTRLTFCLKELRSLLMFAEYLQLPICTNFSKGGLPMVLSVSQGQEVSCTYVLATLAEQGEAQRSVMIPTTTSSTSVVRSTTSSDSTLTNNSQVVLDRQHSTLRDTQATESCGNLTPNLSTIAQVFPPNNNETLENTLDLPPPTNDFMDETPPAKKRKNFFFKRCFDATFKPENVPGTKKILAPDSDEDM